MQLVGGITDKPVGDLADVNKTVLMHADIHECTKVGYIGYDTGQLHTGLEVADDSHIFIEGKVLEGFARITAGFGQLLGEFDALGFAAAERVRCLTQRKVAQANGVEAFQAAMNLLEILEEGQCLGIAPEMFTPIFALSRTVGWISQWKEMIADPQNKIGRPRQLYTGYPQRSFVPLEDRE